MTRMEVLFVVAVIVALSALLMAHLASQERAHHRISCVSNLHNLGFAYKIFANDHDDKFPFWVTNSLGFGNVTQTWLHFQAMSNECGSAKILICYSDRERYTNIMSDFGMGPSASANSLSSRSNRAVSFTTSLDADESNPNAILTGDRHLLTNRWNMDGRVFLAVNTQTVSWTKAIHDGTGNYALSDGSVLQATSLMLDNQVQHQLFPTNRLLLPLLP